MAVETTTISGQYTLPDGTVATQGRVYCTLQGSKNPTADDGGNQVAIGKRTELIIAADGTLKDTDGETAAALVPNDAITPAGTWYDVRFVVQEPDRYVETRQWQIDTAPDPVAIGDISTPSFTVDEPGTGFTPIASLPTASASYLGKAYRLTQTGGGGEQAGIYVCLEDPNSAGTYNWIPVAFGG